MPRFSLFLSLLFLPVLLASAPAPAGPPVRERADFAVVTLNRLVLEARPEPVWGLLPVNAKQLPLSVQLYLRPSGQLDHLTAPVQKAAAQVRKILAPGAKQADRLRNALRVAGAVREHLEKDLPLDGGLAWASKPSLDLRLAWPKASAIFKEGKADQDGQALAAVALLRALKVPARVAWARGHYTAQYWCALAEARPAKKASKSKNRPALGAWLNLDLDLSEAEVDAYSLDNGMLAPLRWQPQEELSASLLGYGKRIFPEDASITAQAAYALALSQGRLGGVPESLSLVAASLTPSAKAQEKTFWVLTVAQWRLEVDGAMGGLDPLDLLTPYRPHLANWGRESQGVVKEMELQAQGVWTDRPTHLKQNGRLHDEWASPPPAMGVLHWVSLGKRRMRHVLQAQREDQTVQGVVLRADNLAPQAGPIQVQSICGTSTVQADDRGFFSLPWCPPSMQLSLGGDLGDSQNLQDWP